MGARTIEQTELQMWSWYRYLLLRQREGHGILPLSLGLDVSTYRQLCLECALIPLTQHFKSSFDPKQQLKDQLLQGQLDRRQEEYHDLIEWLGGYQVAGAAPMAQIIAIASLGFHHLWLDLGLESREQLAELIGVCFPELISMNQPVMRWKKFFYRQLCQQNGALVCRSPSCDICSQYSECFEAP
jgi:nitrogen fixation protein NifQ